MIEGLLRYSSTWGIGPSPAPWEVQCPHSAPQPPCTKKCTGGDQHPPLLLASSSRISRRLYLFRHLKAQRRNPPPCSLLVLSCPEEEGKRKARGPPSRETEGPPLWKVAPVVGLQHFPDVGLLPREFNGWHGRRRPRGRVVARMGGASGDGGGGWAGGGGAR